jgi:hypothetical protein
MIMVEPWKIIGSFDMGFNSNYNRWETDAIDMPDHMKVLLRSLIDLMEDFKGEVRSEGRLYSVEYGIDEVCISSNIKICLNKCFTN